MRVFKEVNNFVGEISSFVGRLDMVSQFVPILRFCEIKQGQSNILDLERLSRIYVDGWGKDFAHLFFLLRYICSVDIIDRRTFFPCL